MAKNRIAYVCSDCGGEHNKWQGQCVDCGAWNTLKEFSLGNAKASKATDRAAGYAGTTSTVQVLDEINLDELPRLTTGVKEFDRVLGGGLVPGSVILIGGHPGAGKSTLLLQTMCFLAQQMPALYITGEESLQQVAMRAKRLGLPTDQLKLLAETNVETICHIARQHEPKVMVVDSIQVMSTLR